MKMMISRDRLREKIIREPTLNTEAGIPTGALNSIEVLLHDDREKADDRVKLKEAFGFFVRQMRRREKMTIYELSKQARIEEDEVRQIESDPHYRPKPRTVHQLSIVFSVPERALMKLSGATANIDQEFQEEAYRFAAKSEDMSSLSWSERRALNEYVRYLAEHKDM